MVTAWEVPQNPLEGSDARPIRSSPSRSGGASGSSSTRRTRRRASPAARSPAQLPSERRPARARAAARRRRRHVSRVQQPRRAPHQPRRPHRRLLPAQRERAPGAAPTSCRRPASKEVLAVTAYITWLATGYAVGANPAWRGKNAIAADKLIPVDKLDAAQRRSDLHGALHVVPRRRRPGRADRRQEGRAAVGTRLVERRRRRGARLHARRHHPLHDAVSRSRAA